MVTGAFLARPARTSQNPNASQPIWIGCDAFGFGVLRNFELCLRMTFHTLPSREAGADGERAAWGTDRSNCRGMAFGPLAVERSEERRVGKECMSRRWR